MVSDRQKELQRDLESLPESFEDNPQIKFTNLCTEFIANLDEYTTAKSGSHTDFFHQIQKKFEKLKSCIHSTRPVFEEDLDSDDSDADEQSALRCITPATDSETGDEGSKATFRTSNPIVANCRHEYHYSLRQVYSSTEIPPRITGCHPIQRLRDLDPGFPCSMVSYLPSIIPRNRTSSSKSRRRSMYSLFWEVFEYRSFSSRKVCLFRKLTDLQIRDPRNLDQGGRSHSRSNSIFL